MQLSEFMQGFDRMCSYYKRNNECPMGCPMIGLSISQCRKVAFERPGESEKIVSDWVKVHPKPVTWREWLGSHGITIRCDGSIQFDSRFDADKPIPEKWME